MGKIIVTVGVSGSGKSTWAKWHIDNHPNTIRVNRDKLREMLYSYEPKDAFKYYASSDLRERENTITQYEDNIIKNALINGSDIIVDATHLEARYCNRFKNFAVHVEYKVFSCDLPTCIARDANRERQVGKAIIRKQYDKFSKLVMKFDFGNWAPSDECYLDDNSTMIPLQINNNYSLPGCVIFDIDGTLAIKGTRSPYDWARVGEDKVNHAVAYALRAHFDVQNHIVICTGRDGSCGVETQKWLADNNIPYHRFYIRPAGNNEKDYIIKERMWREIAKELYIECLYDDRDQVTFHGRNLGLDVFQVNYGAF